MLLMVKAPYVCFGRLLCSATSRSNLIIKKSSKLRGEPGVMYPKHKLHEFWMKNFLRMPLDRPKQIIKVENELDCDKMLKCLLDDSLKLVGYDTEGYSHVNKLVPWKDWDESDKHGRKPAITNVAGPFVRCIQIAMLNGTVYFIDLFSLQKSNDDLPQSLLNFLMHSEILKLIWDATAENRVFKNSFSVDETIYSGFQNSSRDVQTFWDHIKPSDVTRSLKQAVYSTFGATLDKEKQLNDWNKPCLESNEIEYACFDALVTFDVAIALKLLFQRVDWMERLNKFKD